MRIRNQISINTSQQIKLDERQHQHHYNHNHHNHLQQTNNNQSVHFQIDVFQTHSYTVSLHHLYLCLLDTTSSDTGFCTVSNATGMMPVLDERSLVWLIGFHSKYRSYRPKSPFYIVFPQALPPKKMNSERNIFWEEKKTKTVCLSSYVCMHVLVDSHIRIHSLSLITPNTFNSLSVLLSVIHTHTHLHIHDSFIYRAVSELLLLRIHLLRTHTSSKNCFFFFKFYFRVAHIHAVLFYILLMFFVQFLSTHSVNMVIFIFVHHYFNDASPRQFIFLF